MLSFSYPGGNVRTPRTEKRVARMDNIMNSLKREQLQRSAEREARIKAKGSPSAGRARLLNFGSPSGPRPPQSTGVKLQSGSRPPATVPRVAIGNPSPTALPPTTTTAANTGITRVSPNLTSKVSTNSPLDQLTTSSAAISGNASATTTLVTATATSASDVAGATDSISKAGADVTSSLNMSVHKDASDGVEPMSEDPHPPNIEMKNSNVNETANTAVTNSSSTVTTSKNEVSNSVATSVSSLTISSHMSGGQDDSLLKMKTSNDLSRPTESTAATLSTDNLPLSNSNLATTTSSKNLDNSAASFSTTVAPTPVPADSFQTKLTVSSVEVNKETLKLSVSCAAASEKSPELVTSNKDTPTESNTAATVATEKTLTSEATTSDLLSSKNTPTTETTDKTASDVAPVATVSSVTPVASVSSAASTDANSPPVSTAQSTPTPSNSMDEVVASKPDESKTLSSETETVGTLAISDKKDVPSETKDQSQSESAPS